MKNNKGFTIVELLTSFVLSMVIVVIMFQLIINLKDLYQITVLKSDLISKQNIMINKIYSDLTEKKVTTINDCGESCVGFIFDDGSTKELRINIVDEQLGSGYLEYDDYVIKVNGDLHFGDCLIDTKITGLDVGYNSLLSISAPIHNKLFGEENFGINIVYPYNNYEVTSTAIDTENGYVSDGLIVRLDAIDNTGNGHSNEVDTWVDLSGNGNDATLYNNPEWNSNSITFDGETNYGLINNTANMGFPNGITIELRLSDIVNSNGDIFSNWNNKGIAIVNRGEPKQIKLFIGIVVEENVLDKNMVANNYFDSNGTLTSTYDNHYIKYYYNGKLINSIAEDGVLYTSLEPFALGANPSTIATSVDTHGSAQYQAVRIYNRALTDEEILNNYKIDNFRF